MVREFGCDLWEYMERNPEVAATFNAAMTASSQMLAPQILDALQGVDLDGVSTVCDVGGGHGYLLVAVLSAYPHFEGCVLELPEVVEEEEAHWAPKVGVEGRCEYIPGDMFDEVPEADAYFLKWILHDWGDEECVDILSTIHDCASPGARLFICETIVPGPDTSHRSKARDADMMVWLDSRERTRAEWEDLIEAGGWDFIDVPGPDEGPISVLEAKRP